MIETNNIAIQNFIIEASLISPIVSIIDKLNKGEFRDCDIKYLDDRLNRLIGLAAETLNIKGVMPPSDSIKPSNMNSYAVSYYLRHFNSLLNYFKSYLDQ